MASNGNNRTRSSINWNKISAIAQIVACVIGAAALFLMWWLDYRARTEVPETPLSMPVAWWMPVLIAVALISTGLLHYRAVVATRHGNALEEETANAARAVALGMLILECGHFLSVYRRLHDQEHERSRFPRKESSWPQFGQIWDAVHVVLFSLDQQMKSFLLRARAAWRELGRLESEVTLFRTGEDTVMVDLIDALERFERQLETFA